jgi:1-acyl-sn-glycerol-3-phosphate acyltransferase
VVTVDDFPDVPRGQDLSISRRPKWILAMKKVAAKYPWDGRSAETSYTAVVPSYMDPNLPVTLRYTLDHIENQPRCYHLRISQPLDIGVTAPPVEPELVAWADWFFRPEQSWVIVKEGARWTDVKMFLDRYDRPTTEDSAYLYDPAKHWF